jgi:hypothetical protein
LPGRFDPILGENALRRRSKEPKFGFLDIQIDDLAKLS